MENRGENRVAAWRAAVDDVGPCGWREIGSLAELPAQVRADSHYWCDQVFTPEANPHDAPGATRSVHCGAGCAPDLIRHDYSMQGLRLRVVEGRNFLLVCVDRGSLDLLALPEGERAAAVARAAKAIFRAPLSFCHCETLTDGSMFCSDPGVDPWVAASWAERAEGGVRDGELWFGCYKRVSQLVGFANPTQWFSDATCGPRRAARPRKSTRTRKRS